MGEGAGKRGGVLLKRALPKKKKTALYVGAAAVACGCRRAYRIEMLP